MYVLERCPLFAVSFNERFHCVGTVCVCTCFLQELLLKAEGLPDGGAQLRCFRQAIVARMASMKNPVTEPSKESSAESVSAY